MNAVLTPQPMTAQQYLEWESLQPEKHEFIAGEIFAMTGVRLNHNRVNLNACALILQALRGQPCGVFMAEVKVRVEAADAYFYPDLVVTCDPADLADGNSQSVQHPWLIAEVLSESTAAYDRGKKFEHYRALASLTHYLLIDADRPHIDLFRKNAEGLWVLHPLGAADSLVIDAPHAVTIPVASLYEGVATPA
jgi:Uma2 family endonuclease